MSRCVYCIRFPDNADVGVMISTLSSLMLKLGIKRVSGKGHHKSIYQTVEGVFLVLAKSEILFTKIKKILILVNRCGIIPVKEREPDEAY